jgi:hypothetical protein
MAPADIGGGDDHHRFGGSGGGSPYFHFHGPRVSSRILTQNSIAK